MKPEDILQSNVLDIVFVDRNKAYGAYVLRSEYNKRIKKSLAATFALAFVFCISWIIYSNNIGSNRSIVAGEPVQDVHIRQIEEFTTTKKIEKPKPAVRKKLLPQIANATIKIVPDKLVDKPVEKISDMNNKIIGLSNQAGSQNSSDVISPPTEGDKNGTAITAEKPEVEKVTKPLTFADIMPEFPGGKEAFLKFMLRNLKEPDDLDVGQKIVVMVRFVVNADGTISGAEILQTGGKYDAEVLGVVKKMPRWKPGLLNGKAVPVFFNLPVTFQSLED